MKTSTLTLLLIFISLYGKSQTTTDLNDKLKTTAESTAERIFQNTLNRTAAWIDTLPQHRRNKLAKKQLDEVNKTRCPDTLECRLDSIAKILALDARKHGVKRIAVWYFNDTITKLGVRMAEKLSIALSNADDSLEIVDRQHIDAVVKEHQLKADGLIDPETAKIFGRFLHADAIITGSIRVWKNVIHINIKMLDVETNVILAGRKIEIPMKQEYTAKPATTATTSNGTYYSLPYGFYYIEESTPENENCVGNQRGVLVVKNKTGKDIQVYLDIYGSRDKSALIKAGEEMTFTWMYHGLYSYTIRDAGNNTLISEGEFIIRTCDYIGFDVR